MSTQSTTSYSDSRLVSSRIPGQVLPEGHPGVVASTSTTTTTTVSSTSSSAQSQQRWMVSVAKYTNFVCNSANYRQEEVEEEMEGEVVRVDIRRHQVVVQEIRASVAMTELSKIACTWFRRCTTGRFDQHQIAERILDDVLIPESCSTK
eukprot:TRINITY_DN67147_c1_g3_i3.p1 TRINITY_DN67147_c1_g3~~TRINITY_DN67147_c1_g3_i3.p1  ORF type:complete len:149 (-),score=9.51 TRINITY_DN67147_c1_g3_i3:785-1231(-)